MPACNRRNDGKSGLCCPQCFLPAEAVSRVTSLWRAWEHFGLDAATGMCVWWHDRADHHMGVLLNPAGTFHSCITQRYGDPKPFNCELAPTGWLQDEREDPSQ